MVKVLLSLKWRYFLASLKGNVWALVGIIFGGLYALGALVAWAIFSAIQGSESTINPTTGMLLIAVGTILSLFWWIVPLFASGADATLDPDHLAPYPLKTKDLQLGQLMGGLIGLPGFTTVLFLLASALLIWTHPVALIAYVVMIPVGLALVLCISRVINLLAIELNSLPGVRQVLIIIGFLLLMGLGPLIAGAALGISEIWDFLPAIMGVIAWTPLGAPFAVVSAVYSGQWLLALAFFVLSVIYLAIAWVLWARLLERAMSRIGEIKGTASSAAVAEGELGIFKYFPATPRGAIAARTAITLLKDPRCNLNVIMVPAFYILFTLFGRIQIEDSASVSNPVMTVMATIFAPAMAGYVYAYLVSYDNSAFSLHVLTPLRGKEDRIGRAWGLLSIMSPLVVLGSLFLSWRTDNFASLPLVLGIGLGMLLTGIGVSAFADMVISIPAPPPGASPFKTPKQTDGFAKTLVRSLIMLVLMAFAIPGGILWIIYNVTQQSIWMWLAGIITLFIGAVVMWIGLTIGAKRYEKHSAATLQRVSKFR